LGFFDETLDIGSAISRYRKGNSTIRRNQLPVEDDESEVGHLYRTFDYDDSDLCTAIQFKHISNVIVLMTLPHISAARAIHRLHKHRIA
jgi:hypothetical protein